MLYMKKTKHATISCKRHDTGISIGLLGKRSVASLEESEDGLVLLINADNCNTDKIKVHIVNNKWNPTSKDILHKKNERTTNYDTMAPD